MAHFQTLEDTLFHVIRCSSFLQGIGTSSLAVRSNDSYYFQFNLLLQKLDQEETPIEINQIRSVKVGRQGRSIPKAFEIFTSDKTYVLKAKDGKNAEEWVQCLSIAVASSHARDAPPSRPPSQHFSLAQSQFGLRTAV